MQCSCCGQSFGYQEEAEGCEMSHQMEYEVEKTEMSQQAEHEETRAHIACLEEMMSAYEMNQYPQDKMYYDALVAGVDALENKLNRM